MKKVNLVKTIIYWLIMAAVLAAYILYNYLGWKTQIYNLWPMGDKLIKTFATLVLAIGISKLVSIIISCIKMQSQRGTTVIKLLQSVVKYAIAIVSIILVLTYFIADTSSIVTSLSMLTLVIGLGAQSLIADIVAGIFIVFEGDYKVGDVVVIDGWRGTVNEIGIRTTKIEDAGGNIQIINNSKIAKVINNSTNLSIAVCDVGIEYGESIERVENVIKENLPYIKERIPAIKEGPFYKGVDSLGDSAVVIKIVAKAKEEDKFQVQRDLNREIKILFDKNNIGIPFPQVTISHLKEDYEDVTNKQKVDANKFVDEQKKLSKHIDENNN